MASNRKKRRPDIRHVPLPELTAVRPDEPVVIEDELTFSHHPKREIARICLFSLPLIAILIFSAYLDTTQPWVVSIAQKLFY